MIDKDKQIAPITQSIAQSGKVVTFENLPLELQQVTHRKKRLALEHYYRFNGNVSALCKHLKIERKTFYNWIDTDDRFRQIIEIQKQETDDKIEQALLSQAVNDNNLTAQIFYLKSRHPNYKPNKQTMAYEDQKSGVRFVLSR